ncbi:heliorhodopsin HeR [Haloarchaeobius sp. FL176]|uniref:heliorhodopsin HeR n=1 Tax=Haloarchaeobius sp. FL176 TaxID=2967129 RepID=UPI002148E060|nr:heliorhodopsin HeR [Haloarchaeobius sp. FL176]
MARTDQTYTRLRQFNAVMAVLHFLQGALMIYLSSSVNWTITVTSLEFQADAQRLEPVLEPWTTIQLSYLVAAFLLISALAHLLIATVLYDSYVSYLERGMNPYRWYEYAVSASVMIVVIAMLAGVWDLGTLVALFSLVAVMNLMGWMMELYNQTTEKTDWTAYIIGSFAGIVPWIVIAITILSTVVGSDGGGPPDFVLAIYASLFVFFNLFAINMVLQYRETWKWQDYLFGEKAYIVLSLVAKSLLAWQVFFGALNAPV